MEIIADSVDFGLNRDCAVAIGKFDGIHVGHRRLLEEILEKKREGLASCVLTFDTSPAVLFGIGDGKVITTREEKRRIFRDLGVDVLVEFPMNRQTAAIEPEDFVKRFLCDALCTRFLAAGEDLSFGRGGRGNAKLLLDMEKELSFEVKTIEKVCIDGTEVSSTYIRSLIENGRMEEAERFLCEPFCVDGTVLHGNGIGHTIGFPTINLIPPKEKLLPPFGVYYSRVRLDGKLYPAVTNVGVKPTVSGESPVGVESCLLDFEGDLYGRQVEVYFHKFMRPERKFEDFEALRQQLIRDSEQGRIYSQQNLP